MHEESLNFFRYVVKHFPNKFEGYIDVLDVGSGDINGNLRKAFGPGVNYQGNDVYPGKNVDIVLPTHELLFFKPTFDTIVSSECFELDPFFTDSLKKIVEILKPEGLFAFTCASTGRPEYGTKKTTPFESLGTKGNLSKFKSYYKNITTEDIENAIDSNKIFSQYAIYYNKSHKDLYFFGIKRSLKNSKVVSIPEYSGKNIELIKCYPEKPAEKLAENLEVNSAEKVAEKPTENPAEKSAEKPAENIDDNVTENLTKKQKKKQNQVIQNQKSVIMLSTEPPNLQPPQIQQEQPSKYFNQGVIRLSTSPPE